MRFFKLVEIDKEEYCKKTKDTFYASCAQSAIRCDDNCVYIASDMSEEEIRICGEVAFGESEDE